MLPLQKTFTLHIKKLQFVYLTLVTSKLRILQLMYD